MPVVCDAPRYIDCSLTTVGTQERCAMNVVARCSAIGAIIFWRLLGPGVSSASESAGSVYTPGFFGDFEMGYVPGPGIYFEDFPIYYSGSANQIQPNLTEGVITNILELTAVSPWEVFGGKVWGGIYIPLTYAWLKSDALSANQGWVSDPYFVPFGLGWEAGYVHVNLFEGLNVPVGQYSSSGVINLGRDYWASDTNLAASWVSSKIGLDLGLDLGLLINTTNGATDYRTGDEIHLDYTVGMHFSEKVGVAAVGYIYRQITGDSGSGAVLGSNEGQSNGIGPAFMYAWSPESNPVTFVAKWIHEFGVQNRFQGNYFELSLALRL